MTICTKSYWSCPKLLCVPLDTVLHPTKLSSLDGGVTGSGTKLWGFCNPSSCASILTVCFSREPSHLEKRHTSELNRMSEVGDATVGKTHLLSYTYSVMKMRKNREKAVEL